MSCFRATEYTEDEEELPDPLSESPWFSLAVHGEGEPSSEHDTGVVPRWWRLDEDDSI